MLERLGPDLPGALILGGMFLALLIAAEIWTRLFRPPAELTRKAVHTLGGVICVFFPLFVRSPLVVLALAAAMSGLFLVCGRYAVLQCLCRIERRTRGSEYYPLAIFLVFLFSQGAAWIYVASILVLALADAGAALVGSRYGSIRYTVDTETKSLEGSLVFALLAFFCIFVPLAVRSPLSVEAAVLCSLLVAVVATGIEAVSRGGMDNLFVPLTVCLILPKITSKSLTEISYQNISLLAILALLSLAVWRSKSMNVGGALTTIFFFYGCWSLGSELWAVPLLGGLALFLLSWGDAMKQGARSHLLRVPVAAGALIPLLVILLIANYSGKYSLMLAPFVAASMQVISSFLWAHSFMSKRTGSPWEIIKNSVITWLFVALLTWSAQEQADTALLALLFIVILAFSSLSYLSRARARIEAPYEWNRYRAIKIYGAALIVLGLELAGLPSWAHWDH